PTLHELEVVRVEHHAAGVRVFVIDADLQHGLYRIRFAHNGFAALPVAGHAGPGSLQGFQLGQHLFQGRPDGNLRRLAFAAGLQFHHTVVQPAFSNCYAQWHPDQLPFGEHDPRPRVAVVENDVHAALAQCIIQFYTFVTNSFIFAPADRADHHLEGRDGARPDNTAGILVLFDGRGGDAGDPYAIAAHLQGGRLAAPVQEGRFERVG